MKHKPFVSIAIIIVLLVSIFGTVGAQDGTPPTPEVTPTPTVDRDAKFFTHPVVQLLASYFSQGDEDEVTPEVPTDPSVTPDPTEPVVTDQDLLAAEIAAYHEEGMGFGQLVKLYAMVQASEEACADQDPAAGGDVCTPLTIDELVTEVHNGAGMGQLFKEYGKPAFMGVGHVKKEMKNQDESGTTDGTEVDEAGDDQPGNGNKPDDKGNGKDKDKGKGNQGKGPKKDK